MNQEKFIKKQKVNSELAKAAWEKAKGDPDQAARLLEPAKLWFKGRFGENGRYGIFMLEWDFDRSEVKEVDVVILGGKKMKGASPRLSSKAFGQKISKYAKSSKKMEGPAAVLENALKEAWEKKDSKIQKALATEDFKSLRGLHRPLINDALDFEVGEKELVHKLKRRIDTLDEEEEADDRTWLPCEISVNPVRGVNFSKLKKNDTILIIIPDPGAANPEIRDAYRRAQKLENEKGYVEAELKSGKKTNSGNIELQMKIMSGVWGKTSCGRDVSFLVTEETAAKRGGKKSGGVLPAALRENFMPILLFVVAIVILVAATWYLLW